MNLEHCEAVFGQQQSNPFHAMNDVPANPRHAWLDLASAWGETGAQWTHWWSHASADSAATAPAPDTARSGSKAPPVAGMATYAQAMAALTACYQPRFQALWMAAQQALLDPAAARTLPAIAEPSAGDRRFHASEWSTLPYFALLKQHYLLTAEYLNQLANLVPLPEQDKRRVRFITRQLVDAMSPSNFAATNPEVWMQALASDGASLVRGLENLIADARKGRISMTDDQAFGLGRNLALTPGDVVYRNDLIELIQYRPATKRVRSVPLLITPPCINKYYILDLQPDNSFVRWAVAQGHTVFMISWRNIPAELGHLDWDDYVEQGVLAALEVVKAVTRSDSVNMLGFCVGGTILGCALAVLAARGDRSVASATFLTTLLDYSDPGEISVYVSRELLAAREPTLMRGQRVHGSELATAFASLRANELVWNYVVKNYLKGETPPAFDLLYWNGDSSNLPGPMYVYYLKNMYLDNRLREPGALSILGESVDLRRIVVPTYVYASRDDHIVPWPWAYRTTCLLGGECTFVMGASGHIAGVINPPGKNRRNYWTNDSVGEDPQAWLAGAQSVPGSWWPHWGAWLAVHAGREKPAPRVAGDTNHKPIEPAPGSYVKATAA